MGSLTTMNTWHFLRAMVIMFSLWVNPSMLPLRVIGPRSSLMTVMPMQPLNQLSQRYP